MEGSQAIERVSIDGPAAKSWTPQQRLDMSYDLDN